MRNKDTLASPLPVMQDLSPDKSVSKWTKALKKVWYFLKGDYEEKTNDVDPAVAIILEIEDKEVARIVRDLHYRTPKSLQAMRNACESCFVLPDDCPYYDYSIFDVKKAIKKLETHPKNTHQKVANELAKINQELASHLSEYLE
jgi:hypothetical protein